MKAILINDDKSLRWDNVPDPVIKSDKVLIKTEAAALNRADLLQREGNKRQMLIKIVKCKIIKWLLKRSFN